jgi:class 3 adenylate cyclase
LPLTVVAPDGGTPAGLDRIEPLTRAPVPIPTTEIAPGSAGRRAVGAMLFGDIRGFSKLNDDQMPRFAETVLAAFAEALDKRGGAVWWRNTMGDALYAVLEDAAGAADCALEIQEGVARIDFRSYGLPDHLALRLGAHLGPVLPVYEPVRKEHALMGSHVTRTARIEPVTPPGMVYVTEAFAAALMLDGHREFSCDYVGHMAAAKDYGRLRMYRLRRVPAPVG